MRDVIVFESGDKGVDVRVILDGDMVWLNREQLSILFDRDIKTIGKHVNKALSEELDDSVVAKFATTANDGNPIINDIGMAALALLVAESAPESKETMIKLIMNMISER